MALIRKTATVTTKIRKALVEQEIHRRAMRQEDHAEAGMMVQPLVPGQSREELQAWGDAVVKGEHPYVHIPANSDFKPVGVEGLTRTRSRAQDPSAGPTTTQRTSKPPRFARRRGTRRIPRGCWMRLKRSSRESRSRLIEG